MAAGSAGRRMRWKTQKSSYFRHPSPGSPYGLGGLSRRDRPGQSVPPCLLVLLMQRSPKTLGRPTFATRGDAQARRGRQQAERAAAATSGRTGGDTSAKSFYSFYKRAKPAATQGSPRGREWASPRRKGTSRLFLSPPSFFFTHEKERWGCGVPHRHNQPVGWCPAYLHEAR